MSKPHIAICGVQSDTSDFAFNQSILHFLHFDSTHEAYSININFEKGLYIDDNRNKIVRDFLKIPADYLLMVDSDIEFDPVQPYMLIDEAVKNDRQILSGLYFSFTDPKRAWPLPLWFSEIDDDDCFKYWQSFEPGEVIVPLAACGMGFCLIRRDVFEKFLTVPEYAEDDWTWFNRDRYKWRGQIKHHGEDVGFCARAGKLGIQTWGHKGVPVRHWKKWPIDFHVFQAMVEHAKQLGIEI